MKNTDVILRIWLSCSLFHIALAVQENDTCTTTESLPGTCRRLHHCKRLYDLFSKPRPLPAATQQLLRAESCGSVNRVHLMCCREETDTPIDVSNHRNVAFINPDMCGDASTDRIIHGNITGVFEMPWMALLNYRFADGKKSFNCGGTLINKRYVLTAAHCVPRDTFPKLVSVRLGEHNTATPQDCELQSGKQVCARLPPQNVKIQKVVKHPGFTWKSLRDDVALIRLAQPADVDRDTIQPICLPVGMAQQNRNLTAMGLTVAGWGITERGVGSPVLLKASVPVLSAAQCRAAFQDGDSTIEINAGQLCAGGYKQDSCRGDSGGPLKGYGALNSKGCMLQYGIVSYGLLACGTEGYPGIYTRVGHYMKWILDNMEP